MPSFFEGLKRIMQGKPVFDVNDKEVEEMHPTPHVDAFAPQQSMQPGTVHGSDAPKEFPMVTIVRCESRQRDQGFECEFYVHNGSSQPIKLMRIETLGLRDELGEVVEHGNQREEILHFPGRPTNTTNNLVTLYFQTLQGDQFYSVHGLLFDQLPDHTFMIRSASFQPPIRDSH